MSVHSQQQPPSLPERDAYPLRYYNTQVAASTTVYDGIPDKMRTSPVRRTFILVSLFDFGFSLLLYFLYLKLLPGGRFEDALYSEVVLYTIYTSYFDTAIIVILRFVCLLVAYGIVLAKNPWTVAGTTFASCLFIIVKCFFYNFAAKGFPALDYLILLLGFCIPWAETVFLECRVLPQERAAERIMATTTESEPLLYPVPVQSTIGPRSFYSAADGFATPTAHSEAGDNASVSVDLDAETQELNRRLTQRAQDLLEQSWQLQLDDEGFDASTSSSSWQLDCEDAALGIRICRRQVDGLGKLFKLEATLDISPEAIFLDTVHNVELLPSWNPGVLSVKRVTKLRHADIDVIHNVAADALGGAISSRDFVSVRTWQSRGECHLLTGCSIVHPDCPVKPTAVRGEMNISAQFFESCGDGSQCKYTWILHSDPKGWIPRKVVDQAMTVFFKDFVKCLKARVLTLRANHNVPHNNLSFPQPPPPSSGQVNI